MKWNIIRNGNNLPTVNGTYLITFAEVESGESYREVRRTVFANFRKRDNSYRWLYPCDHGTAHDVMNNQCEKSWSYTEDGVTTDYRESIVAWAPMLAPYADDFPAICATVDKKLVNIDSPCDGVIGLYIGGNNHD